ncbi:unnamed protein product [Allacma fusca]|uniref:Protein SON n=1 Tax=Allacma fusca TaxID=39272 RepID=A0A8J2L3D6_9HEXA|nr:unnamed protein product [Allacma fusca]
MEEVTESCPGGQTQLSADDILNELFTELGSKKPTDSIADFLGSPMKKKKKHKEKEKKKGKEKDKDKKKKLKSKKKKELKQSKKVKSKVEDSGVESVPVPAKKLKLEKKSHSDKSAKKCGQKDAYDLEDGEIKDKPRSSKKRKYSVVDDDNPEDLYYEQRHTSPSFDAGHLSTKRRRSRSAEFRDDCKDKGRSLSSKYLYNHDDKEPDGKHVDNRNHDKYSPPRRNEFDKNYSNDGNYEKSYNRNYDRSSDKNHGVHYERKDSEYRNYDRGSSPSRSYDERRYEPQSRSSNYRKPYNSGYEGDHFRRRNYDRQSRSRSRPRNAADVIDKAKLLEIARRNATLLMKKGVLPTDIFSKDQIMAIKAGGKSVEELTSYCRRLARKDARGEDDVASGNESETGEHEHFIHHPFVVKERPMPQITLNIRNAIPLPVRTPQELAIENAVRKSQFPVSSGCQHRFKELEWKEVEPDDEKNKDKKTKTETVAEDSKPVGAVVPLVHSNIIETTASAVVADESQAEKGKDTGISLEPPELPQVDIGSVISARLKAMRTLKDNPDSEDAKKELENALVEMDQWAQAKALEPKFLSVSELQTGPQAWAKRDQLKNAKEVASGMGMHLLQKMGWRPGEGLGKNKEGTTQPLALDVKTDKKGLSSQADLRIKGPQANIGMLYDLSGKHPVSALMELCTKRRWGPPAFELCFEHGPAHQKSFVYKVTVNGVEYQPCIATNNKKLAKANAAAFCLQSLGLLKCNPSPNPAETLQTVQPITTEVAGIKMVSSHLLQTVPNNP